MLKLKHLYFLSTILLVAVVITGIIERKKYVAVDEIIWSEDNITWDNFTRVKSLDNDYVATIYSEIYSPKSITWLDSKIYAYMEPSFSQKLADSLIGGQELNHEQYHFNITEYYARLLRREIVKYGKKELTKTILDSLHKKYSKEEDYMQKQYDSITDHNVNTEKQRYWEMKIDDLMRQTIYYQNPDILSYHDYNNKDTEYYRKIHRTFDDEILVSHQIYKENLKFGETYKIENKKNEIIISFFKDGELKNGGIFNTAITSIKKNKKFIEIKYFGPDHSLNNNLDYCILKRLITKNKKIDYYYNANKKRVIVNNVYQAESNVESEEIFITSYFDNNLNKVKNKDGIYYKKRTLDSLGRTIKLELLDSNKSLINDVDLISLVTKKYDSNNQLIEYQEFDEDGTFATHMDSYNIKYEYDKRGNIARKINLNENSEIASDKKGIAIYNYTYDLNDNRTSVKRFNKINEPVRGTENYHMAIEKFDKKGRSLFYGKYYPGYVLSFNDEKWGASKYSYVNDSITRVANLDVYNNNFEDNTGVAIYEQHLDKQGKVKRTIYFDKENNYAKTEDEIVEYHYEYDERGNQIEDRSLDSLGNLKAFDADVAMIKWSYDVNDNKTKTTYYNSSSELAQANQNVTYNIYVYNDKNQLIERSNYNMDMEPELLDGYFKRKIISNTVGNDSIVWDFDINNKLINGACKTVYAYNKYNNIISESFFNENDEPSMKDAGVHQIENYYNDKQEFIGYAYFDLNGKKTNNNEGISYNYQTLNEFGYIIRDYYYDKNDGAVLGPEGYHIKEYTWNGKGENTKIRTYGTNKKLIEDEAGVAEYKYTLSESGLIRSIKRFDKYGNLTNDSTGVAETYYSPYLNGLYFLDKELDSFGNEISND